MILLIVFFVVLQELYMLAYQQVSFNFIYLSAVDELIHAFTVCLHTIERT